MQMRAPFPFLSTTLPSPFPLLPFPSRRPFHYRATACCGGGIRHACLLCLLCLLCCTAWALPCQISMLACCLALRSSLARPPARSAQGRAASPRTPMPTPTQDAPAPTHPHPHAKREHTSGRSRRPSLLRPVAPRLPRPLSTPVNSLHPPSLSLRPTRPSLFLFLASSSSLSSTLTLVPVTSHHLRM